MPDSSGSGEQVVAGSDPSCNVVLQVQGVAPQHARFGRGPYGLFVEDLGTPGGTWVNGQRVTAHVLQLTDDVRLATAPLHPSDPRIAGLVVHVPRVPAPGQPLVLGSDLNADVIVHHPDVAPHHAMVSFGQDGTATVRDSGSAGGTYLDSAQFRVAGEVQAHAGSTLFLGRFALPVWILQRLIWEAQQGRAGLGGVVSGGSVSLDRPVITVGRNDGCDLVLNHPTVSGNHAKLTRQADGSTLVEDQGSTNGTFVNGQRVKRATARPGDQITVGAVVLDTSAGTVAAADRARVRLDLLDISLIVKDRSTGRPRPLLDQVSLSIFPSEMVGMLGPSGAGKTTLLMTVLGITSPSRGRILFNARPLRAQYEAFRTNVGYVPQDDIVHPELTVREALYFACRLRLPFGTSGKQIDEAIDRTLSRVGLLQQKKLQIGSAEKKVLSGGQRRRVNLAVELVTDPSLLVLDEPTSGLSWTDAAEVIATLRRLADDGRTVVMTIHQPDFQEYEKFDTVVILARGGKLVFAGPPAPDSYEFFGAEHGRPRQMFDHVEQVEPDEWRTRFQQTQTHQRFITERLQGLEGGGAVEPAPKPRSRSSFLQFPILFLRNLLLLWRNKAALALLLIQAPLLGLVIGLATGDAQTYRMSNFGCTDASDFDDVCNSKRDAFSCNPRIRITALRGREVPHATERVPDPRTGLLAVLLALFLPMLIVSANSLVSERTIFERERLAGLNIIPYVLARFSVLAFMGTIVASLHLIVALPLLGLEGFPPAYWIVGVLTTTTAVALGLVMSAIVKSSTAALWGINLLVVPQLLFAGTTTKLEGFTSFLSYFTVTRHGLEALSHVDLASRDVLHSCQIERFMVNVPGYRPELDFPIISAMFWLGSMAFWSLVATMIILKIRELKITL